MPNLAKIFHGLHRQTDILILPNAWDAGSAKLIEDAGAKAIATSSAGVAWALGYPDGDALPPRMLADLTARIAGVIRIPLSVDFEGAYTTNPSKVGENLKPIIDAGAIGINIEDAEGTPELLAKKIEKARKARSEEHTSELQSRLHLVCRLLLEKKKTYATPDPKYTTRFSAKTSRSSCNTIHD